MLGLKLERGEENRVPSKGAEREKSEENENEMLHPHILEGKTKRRGGSCKNDTVKRVLTLIQRMNPQRRQWWESLKPHSGPVGPGSSEWPPGPRQ